MASQYVSDGGVSVPNPKDESLLAAAEPVGHDSHDAGPARGLEDATGDLHQEEEKELIDWDGCDHISRCQQFPIVHRDTSSYSQVLIDII